MKHRVLLIEPTIQPVGVKILKDNCDVFMAPDGKEETLIRYINENEIEGVLTRVEYVTRRVIENCPGLKVICQHGVGLDNVDVQAAAEHGIRVLNVPDGNFISVAEHAMLFILCLSRNIINADQNVRKGNWNFRETNIPSEIYDKNLLIIGLGRIGRDIAKKAQVFGMNILGYDPFVTKEQMAELNIRKAETLEGGLAEADYTTIQLHLTPETRGMISTEQFKAMKKTGCILNLSRGPVIDQKALTEALASGEIAAAALDVFDKEPPEADDPLLKLPNVIVTPHQGGDTWEAKQRVSTIAATTLVKTLNGEDTYNWANKKAMETK